MSSVYNAVTGSNVKAPVGSVFNWANQGLLKLEGRGSVNDIVRSLMQDYRAKQTAAMRDLPSGHADTDALRAANAERETAFLVKIKSVAVPTDGLAGLLDAADQSTGCDTIAPVAPARYAPSTNLWPSWTVPGMATNRSPG